MNNDDCPFCCIEAKRIWIDNRLAMAVWDDYPCAYGYVLVVPRRHVASLFELKERELLSVWELVREARERLEDKYHNDGFNIGVNDGAAAGQTVMHAHVHVIPRRQGDVDDPRGGVRWVIPERAVYWNEREK